MEQSQLHEEIRRWLLEPSVYGDRTSCVEELETHISRVFLAGEYVYKLKKPVRFEFLDFSTAALREFACKEELRLNRRLAPDTYLDVLSISRQRDGGFSWGQQGEVVDWVVKMRRLPTERTLDKLYAQGKLLPEHIERLMATLLAFYRSAPPLDISPSAYRERYVRHVEGNLHDLAPFGDHIPRSLVRRVHGFQLQLLHLRSGIFDERVAGKRIVDGHGDLRPEHICFDDPITIFDCLEFNAEFRHLDVADELSFLVSECDFLGADWVGPLVWRRYRQESGDIPPLALVDFYLSYRACVRAKVAALRAKQLNFAAAEAALAETQKHLILADAYCQRWLTPLVIAVGGLSGTGKTTLSKALAATLGAELLRTDVIRKELFGEVQRETRSDQGIYSPDAREIVYQELFRRAGEFHREGVSVVLDGTFATRASILDAQQVASRTDTFVAIECVCPAELACARIAQRQLKGGDESDAQIATYHLQKARWENWMLDQHVRIDTHEILPAQQQRAIEAIARRVRLAADNH